MNYSSVKSLDWKTPVEKLQGKTPDISMFQFRFWAPVWYYEPTAKFPAPNFLPAQHLDIASEHGDYFIYKFWTLPNNKWETDESWYGTLSLYDNVPTHFQELITQTRHL